MTQVETFQVNLTDRGYQILVGPNLLCNAAEHLSPLIRHKPVIIITDSNVSRHHLEKLTNSLIDGDIAFSVITLPAGEGQKGFESLQNLITAILDKKPERSSTLIALGGGVIGDLTGFVASIILRGIDFIQVPTTLLSQVDSSVGGKTAINMSEGKNLVGSFYQPKAVIADVSLLSTLPNKEIISGFAEVIKYAVLGNKSFFEWLEINQKELLDLNTDLLIEAVSTSCKMKAQIVEEDEQEKGTRALLNLGHTFGHAIENKMNNSGSNILHGEAVGFGMCLSAQFSNKLDFCSGNDVEKIIKIIKDFGIPSNYSDLNTDLKANEIIDIFAKDKKRKDDKNTLILLNGIGKAFIQEEVKDTDINDFLISVGFK